MPKMICAIIACILLVLPWSLAVLDPALLHVECVKYLSYLVGSVISEVATSLGVVVGGSYSFSK
jgi:hypothetical protein